MKIVGQIKIVDHIWLPDVDCPYTVLHHTVSFAGLVEEVNKVHEKGGVLIIDGIDKMADTLLWIIFTEAANGMEVLAALGED